MEIEWEDPPEEVLLRRRAGSGAKYVDFAIALRDHPGRWAVLPADPPYSTEKSAAGAAQNIRRGVVKAFAKNEYDAVHEGTKVWVLFRGKAEDVGDAEPGEGHEPPVPGQAAKIRAWAKEQGIEVPDRGRLPQDVSAQYYANHPDEQMPPELRAVQ